MPTPNQKTVFIAKYSYNLEKNLKTFGRKDWVSSIMILNTLTHRDISTDIYYNIRGCLI